jgi:nucleotide-binding universal stress UspA family protein
MFRKILLPVDLTDKHANALETAADLASGSGGEVVLLHVIEVIPSLSMEEEREFYNRLEKKARAHLSRLGGRLKDRSVPWREEVVYGHRVSEALRFATASGVDVIVLTAPRFDPSNVGAGWGSLSYKISVLSPCPVLLVK